MTIQVITDVTTEPVTAAELRDWLSLDSSAQDTTLLEPLIKSARSKIQRLLGMSIGEMELSYTLMVPPGGLIYLPFPPIVSVDTVTMIAEDGTETVTTDYTFQDNRIILNATGGNVVTIEYTVGSAVITDDLKTLIKKQAAFDYLHRGDDDAPLYAPDVKAEAEMITVNLGF